VFSDKNNVQVTSVSNFTIILHSKTTLNFDSYTIIVGVNTRNTKTSHRIKFRNSLENGFEKNWLIFCISKNYNIS
jgi:hypothetical protein